jgi:flagellar biosynthesis protein FliR
MLQEIFALNVFGFFLIFARMGTVFMLLPGFSALYVSTRIRMLLALTVSFAVSPMLMPGLPGLPATIPELALLLGGEISIGLFMGVLGRILIGALQTTGTVIAYVSSMANAFIQDPVAEQQSTVMAGFLGTLGVMMIFVTDAHHLMLRAVFDSYSLFVPGRPPPLDNFTEVIASHVSASFNIGVQMAAPFVISGLTYYIGIGLLTRLMPQMPVFFVGLPIQIAIQVTLVMLALSGIMMVFMTHFGEGYRPFLVP